MLNPKSEICNPQCTRRAFTLVELMVTIGIIGLLVAILIPAVAAARKSAKVASTRGTIAAIETGLETFKANAQIGGAYPPSLPDNFTSTSEFVRSPHIGGKWNQLFEVSGANFLAWALVGADQLGTPGFYDTGVNQRWSDDTGKLINGGENGLYTLNADGTPAFSRYGPYVEPSKVKITPVDTNGYIVPSALDAAVRLQSLCFLDSFDQPILYYRATRNLPTPWTDGWRAGVDTPGIYNLADNARITGNKSSEAGIDMGKGVQANGKAHPIAELRVTSSGNPIDPVQDKGTFAHTIWNPGVTATLRPHNADSFIVLTPGPDGLYGTADDIGNFPANQ
jgi:prepilin-type N-terminal cleavage/methylation domain-containing protein